MRCKRCKRKLQLGDFPFCRGNPDDHIPSHRRYAQAFRPVVVFRDAKGQYKFPGRDTDPAPKGFEKVTLSTSAQVQKFEREMGARLKRERQQQSDVEGPAQEASLREMRSELIQMMRGEKLVPIRDDKGRVVGHERLSVQGRDLAQLAMDRNNQETSRQAEPVFFVEPFHVDSSNRLPWRDQDTGGKARY